MPSSAAVAEYEFRVEAKQSLERAFAEGHSVDNAAVELKTLRMASNVPLSRVREAVVGAIVERIKIGGEVAEQRKEIATVISRWGELINKIGGVDAVEAITALQVSSRAVMHDTGLHRALYPSSIVLDRIGFLYSGKFSQRCIKKTSWRRRTSGLGMHSRLQRVRR